MKKIFIIAIITFIATIIISFVVYKVYNRNEIEKFIDNRDTREIVEVLENDLDEEIKGVVKQDNIELSLNNEVVKLVDDQEQFYVSIAPYFNQTHEWSIHFLAGCKGELDNKKFDVTITSADGKVIYEGDKKTYNNGFMGFWLPKDQVYSIIIEADGKQADGKIETYKDSKTCITTFKLT